MINGTGLGGLTRGERDWNAGRIVVGKTEVGALNHDVAAGGSDRRRRTGRGDQDSEANKRFHLRDSTGITGKQEQKQIHTGLVLIPQSTRSANIRKPLVPQVQPGMGR